MTEQHESMYSAREDFKRARQQASLQEILGLLTGHSVDLLSYEEVRKKLRATGTGIRRGLQEIPIEAIVGSAGRYADFTRSFLPRTANDETRWANVMQAMTSAAGTGLPPIEVYKIGESYFVHDGHHRVSVAHHLGNKFIEAFVTEIPSQVHLEPDTSPDELIVKAEQAEFLEETRLNVLCPETDFTLTEPGKYQLLLEHIQMHQYFMGIDKKRDIPIPEAVKHWHKRVYLPVIKAIRAQGILRDFPGRTETDLYLWVSNHRTELQQGIGNYISPAAAATDLAEKFGTSAEKVTTRIGRGIVDAMLPTTLEDGPPAGAWREERKAQPETGRLIRDILVPISEEDSEWSALEQAVFIARNEKSSIHGLHIGRDPESVESVRAEFERRCSRSGSTCGLAVEHGNISKHILDRARLVDLVTIRLQHPPSSQRIARLSSGFRTLIRKCPRPILAVPRMPSPLDNALLAYDGSPKAREGLFFATYLAEQWRISLSVVTVIHGAHADERTLEEARLYLTQHGIQAEYIAESGKVTDAIQRTIASRNCNLLIMGGYGNNPVVEAMLGSDLDWVLRASEIPILICR